MKTIRSSLTSTSRRVPGPMPSFLRASWGKTTWFLLLNVTVEGMEHRKAICEIISRPDTLASLGRVRSVLNEWFQLDGLVFAPAAAGEVGDDFYIAAHRAYISNKRTEPHVFAALDLRDVRLLHVENFGELLL